MTPTIVWTSFILVVLFGKACIDYYLIKNNKAVHHGVEIVIAGGVTILHGIFIADVHTPVNWVPDDYTLAVLLFYPLSWWSLFDGILNRMLGRQWFEIGRTAWSDRLFRRLGQASYELSKWVATGLMLYCIYLIYTEWS